MPPSWSPFQDNRVPASFFLLGFDLIKVVLGFDKSRNTAAFHAGLGCLFCISP